MPIDTFYLDKLPRKKVCRKCHKWFTPDNHYKHTCQKCAARVRQKPYPEIGKQRISIEIKEHNDFVKQIDAKIKEAKK